MRCEKINLIDEYPFLGEEGCMPVLNTYLPDNLSEMHRENQSYPVAASILCYPVITADPAYAHMGSIENVSGHKPITPEDVKRFSCELLVTEQTPPAYIWHTAEDQCVPLHNSFLYAKALSEKNIPFELHVFPFGAHGLATCDEHTNDGEITERTAHNQRWIEESQQCLKLLWANHGQGLRAYCPQQENVNEKS